VIGARLDELLRWMRASSPEPFEARGYVDTGPVQERVYAQHAGIGWIGKNTCVINPQLGSWIFLAEIICSLPLEVDAPALDQCGTCTLCLEACPTDALGLARRPRFDACISYLTIELRGDCSGRASRRHRRACVWLRHLPGSLPMECGGAALRPTQHGSRGRRGTVSTC
jgi:epoxyqueuosine reductase